MIQPFHLYSIPIFNCSLNLQIQVIVGKIQGINTLIMIIDVLYHITEFEVASHWNWIENGIQQERME